MLNEVILRLPWPPAIVGVISALFIAIQFTAPGWAQQRVLYSPGGHSSSKRLVTTGDEMIASAIASSGSSSKRQKEATIRRIPMRQLSAGVRPKVASVLDNASIYRRLPVTTVETDPDLYLFLVRYPETMLSIWQIMGVTKMSAERVGPFTLKFDDGVGTDGNVQLVYGTPRLNIYYGEGVYEGPMLFRKVTGQCVLVLRTDYERNANGNPQTRSQLDIFLKIDHLAASLIAKTVHPLIGTTADHNFVESLRFVQKLSKTTERNGHGVQGLSQRLTSIRPEVQQRFREIAELVSKRARAERMTLRANSPDGSGYTNEPASYPQKPR